MLNMTSQLSLDLGTDLELGSLEYNAKKKIVPNTGICYNYNRLVHYMRVIARKTLKVFWSKYKDAEQPLKAWFELITSRPFDSPNQIKAIFGTSDILPGDRVVFNIKGNKYRLIVAIKYKPQIMYIRFIGTHSEYDKIDARKI